MTQIKMAALGLDHRHIYGQLQHMIDAGAALKTWWTDGAPETLAGFLKRFPQAPRAETVDSILSDPEIDLIVIAAIPEDRAALAIRAMEAGKDVMVDKPGCTTQAQLSAIQEVQARTGRIWSVDFSERFEVPCVTRAADLVAAREIGQVLQTVGLGPHRLNRATRPDWFFERARYGGILTDIASHQIDQFLYFTGSDGRLTILGTKGTIELRKYVDVAGAPGTDHLYLTNETRCEKIDCSDAGLPYFPALIHDITHRTETAMPQAHAFKVMELALKAQSLAET